jgi:hypothetical protein
VSQKASGPGWRNHGTPNQSLTRSRSWLMRFVFTGVAAPVISTKTASDGEFRAQWSRQLGREPTALGLPTDGAVRRFVGSGILLREPDRGHFQPLPSRPRHGQAPIPFTQPFHPVSRCSGRDIQRHICWTQLGGY